MAQAAPLDFPSHRVGIVLLDLHLFLYVEVAHQVTSVHLLLQFFGLSSLGPLSLLSFLFRLGDFFGFCLMEVFFFLLLILWIRRKEIFAAILVAEVFWEGVDVVAEFFEHGL